MRIISELNPLNMISNKTNESFRMRVLHANFWERVEDAFDVLAGTCVFSLHRPTDRAVFPPIVIQINPLDTHNNKLGLLDYSPLIVLRLLMLLGIYLAYNPLLNVPKNLFIRIAEFCLTKLGVGLVILACSIQFLVATVLTLLSLPVIGIVNFFAQRKMKALEQEFLDQYTQQTEIDNLSTITLTNKKTGQTYTHAPMKSLLPLLNPKNCYSFFNDDSDDFVAGDVLSRPVLFAKPNPANPFQNQLYFFKFNYYSQAGATAFRTLAKINPALCHTAHTHTLLGKRTQQMMLTFATLAQMSRNPNQQVENENGELTTLSGCLPLDIAREIAIRIEEADHLSLDEGRFMLNEMYLTLCERPTTSPKIEEITDEGPAEPLMRQ